MHLTLGVRPVDVLIDRRDSGAGTPIPVSVYENLGDERRLGVRVGDSLLNLTTAEPIYYERGDSVRLRFNAERTHLFDLNTGERIRSRS